MRMTHSAVTNVRDDVFYRIRRRHQRLDEAGGALPHPSSLVSRLVAAAERCRTS
jgi:hypothetical protein